MASGYILALTLFIVAAAADPFIREVVINRLKTHDIPNIPLFKGIINGNLNPYCYTRFLNQDSYYLNWSVHLWETAHNISSSDPSFQKFSHVMFE